MTCKINRNVKCVIMISMIIVSAFISGCFSKFTVIQHSQPINITRLELTDDALNIEWSFTNTSGSDVWVCEGLKYYLRDSFFAYIENDILHICLKCFDAPFVAPEIPVVSIYRKVPKGKEVNRLITIPFELEERVNINKRISLSEAAAIVIEIGVLEKLPENTGDIMEVQSVSPLCGGETVYSVVLKKTRTRQTI